MVDVKGFVVRVIKDTRDGYGGCVTYCDGERHVEYDSFYDRVLSVVRCNCKWVPLGEVSKKVRDALL